MHPAGGIGGFRGGQRVNCGLLSLRDPDAPKASVRATRDQRNQRLARMDAILLNELPWIWRNRQNYAQLAPGRGFLEPTWREALEVRIREFRALDKGDTPTRTKRLND